MSVAIIDYGSGNLHSAAKAFERAAYESGHAAPIIVTADPGAIRRAERVVLPGVGAFADCLGGLRRIEGMVEALEESIIVKGRPFLGICVGLQLLAERGLEHGVTVGLGWLQGEVRAISPSDASLKIPHMGWNTLHFRRPHALLNGIPDGAGGWHAYFVHSYHLAASKPETVIAECDYGGAITAIAGQDNIAGVQFHPEKSQKLGIKLIANFLRWRP